VDTVTVIVGVLAGLLAIGGLAALAIRKPSRSTRREKSTWDDTNFTSGGGGPD
jgi:nitrate reductase gamma subunit